MAGVFRFFPNRRFSGDADGRRILPRSGIDVTVVKMGNSFLAYYALMRACGARAEINGISMVMIFVGTRVLTATNSIPYHR